MKDVFVNIRMTVEMKEALTQMAKTESRSLSGQIVFMLSQSTPKPTKQVRVVTDRLGVPDGVSEQTWADFKALRNAKKAPITARAIEGIDKEAMKAGMTLEAALRECCARGWAGFNHEWVRSKQDEVAALLRPSVPYLEM
jgi:hypothetical protein